MNKAKKYALAKDVNYYDFILGMESLPLDQCTTIALRLPAVDFKQALYLFYQIRHSYTPENKKRGYVLPSFENFLLDRKIYLPGIKAVIEYKITFFYPFTKLHFKKVAMYLNNNFYEPFQKIEFPTKRATK